MTWTGVTSGVDLAAQPIKTGLCIIDWSPDPVVRVVARSATDEQILDAIDRSAVCAIDAPFGWPDAFVDFVREHSGHLGPAPPPDTVPLRMRATDRWVHDRSGIWPLSVSTDKIGIVAFRCARLQIDAAAMLETPVDRTGAGRLAEVYPKAALYAWGLLPSPADVPDRLEWLSTQLVEEFRLGIDGAGQMLISTNRDAFDAVVCAIVAREVAMGHTTFPPELLTDAAQREGWIHVPRHAPPSAPPPR